MLETVQILKAIEENNAKELPLKFKNSKTGEVVGFDSHYVLEEIYFIIANKNSSNSCDIYLRNLESEACDECWNSHIYIDDLDEDVSIEDMNYNELQDYRLNVVENLETALYVGEFEDFDNCNEFETMKSIEVLNDCVLITY